MKKSIIIAAILYSFTAQGMSPDQDTVASPFPQFELCRRFYKISDEEQNIKEKIKQIADSNCPERESEKRAFEETLAVIEQDKEHTRKALYAVLFEEWFSITRPLVPSEVGPAQRFIQFLQTQGKTIAEVRVMDAQTWIKFRFKDNPSLQGEQDRLIELSQGNEDISPIIDELVVSSACVKMKDAPFSAEDTRRVFREKFLKEVQQSSASRDMILALYAHNRTYDQSRMGYRDPVVFCLLEAEEWRACTTLIVHDIDRFERAVFLGSRPSPYLVRSLFRNDDCVSEANGFYHYPNRRVLLHESGHALCLERIRSIQRFSGQERIPALEIAHDGFSTKIDKDPGVAWRASAGFLDSPQKRREYLFTNPAEVFQVLGIGAFSYPDDPERFILIINRLSDFTASVECGVPPRCDHWSAGMESFSLSMEDVPNLLYLYSTGKLLLSGAQIAEAIVGLHCQPVLAFWEPLFELHGCPKEVYEPWLQPWREEQAAQS
jgi:hypothetical protein